MLEFKLSSWLFIAMFVILFNISSSEKIAANISFPRIIVLEDSNSTAPSLANIIIGYEPADENGLQNICQPGGLCSEGISVGTGRWLGEGINTAVLNIKGVISDDVTVLSKAIGSANLVIVDIDVTKELDTTQLDNLRKLGSFMDIWNQTVIQLRNFDQSKSIKSRAEVLETFQTVLEEEFDCIENLPGIVFSVQTSNQDVQSFQAEVSSLFQTLSMMALKDSVNKFSVLQSEDQMLKEENKILNDEIIKMDKKFEYMFQMVMENVGMDFNKTLRDVPSEENVQSTYTYDCPTVSAYHYGDVITYYDDINSWQECGRLCHNLKTCACWNWNTRYHWVPSRCNLKDKCKLGSSDRFLMSGMESCYSDPNNYG